MTNPEGYDPESEGIPSVADDTSTAYDIGTRYRPADDTAPPLPMSNPRPRPRDVGRLVDPDMGGPEDTEAQAVAFDTGELMGLSAEEAAMHLIPEKEDETE